MTYPIVILDADGQRFVFDSWARAADFTLRHAIVELEKAKNKTYGTGATRRGFITERLAQLARGEDGDHPAPNDDEG